MKFTLLDGLFAVARLEADADVPPWAHRGAFTTITRTPHELSIVCDEGGVPDDVPAERGWRCLGIDGPISFETTGVAARFTEAITLKGDEGQGIAEQIDGVVELKGLFLAEMKWEAEPLGRDKIASHLVRVFNRSLAGGLFISYSGYTPAAIQDCKDALREKAIVLCELAELVH